MITQSWPPGKAGSPMNRRPAGPNEALTLEQLKCVENLPVWTVTLGVEGSGKWEIISWKTIRVSPLLAVLSCVNGYEEYPTEYPLDTYGKTWLAYRHKPEGSE